MLTNLIPSISKLYPDGVIGPGAGAYRGQCAKFCSTVIGIGGMGNLLKDKVATINARGIPVSKLNGDFQVGDVVITNDNPTYGHAFILGNKLAGRKGHAAESNWNGDGRVHYSRLVDLTSPRILGVLRGPILIPIINIRNYMFYINKGTVYAEVEGKLQGLAMGEADLYAEYPGATIVPITDDQFNQLKGSWVMAPTKKQLATASPLKLSASQVRRLAATKGNKNGK